MSAAERVARGAAFLDDRDPDWWREIALDVLDMGDGCRCVLGQLWTGDLNDFDDEAYGYAVAELGIDGPAFGFNALDLAQSADAVQAEFRELDELWIAEIRRRQESAR